MKNNLNQYIVAEYENLKSEAERREFVEKIRFLMVAEDTCSDDTVATWRMKAYSFTTKSGRNVPQIILQGNWAEQWGFEIGCSVSEECYQNKLDILKD
ncbi:hypothetical protein AALB16_00010 [Lachnospiraceae bacterium 62-35]